MRFINGFGTLFWLGLIVFVAGRFHWLFRDRSADGDFATRASNCVRFGSVLVTIALWSVDLCIKGMTIPH
jgi:hypothetical protein